MVQSRSMQTGRSPEQERPRGNIPYSDRGLRFPVTATWACISSGDQGRLQLHPSPRNFTSISVFGLIPTPRTSRNSSALVPRRASHHQVKAAAIGRSAAANPKTEVELLPFELLGRYRYEDRNQWLWR